jgi:hypothetical protein
MIYEKVQGKFISSVKLLLCLFLSLFVVGIWGTLNEGNQGLTASVVMLLVSVVVLVMGLIMITRHYQKSESIDVVAMYLPKLGTVSLFNAIGKRVRTIVNAVWCIYVYLWLASIPVIFGFGVISIFKS